MTKFFRGTNSMNQLNYLVPPPPPLYFNLKYLKRPYSTSMKKILMYFAWFSGLFPGFLKFPQLKKGEPHFFRTIYPIKRLNILISPLSFNVKKFRFPNDTVKLLCSRHHLDPEKVSVIERCLLYRGFFPNWIILSRKHSLGCWGMAKTTSNSTKRILGE